MIYVAKKFLMKVEKKVEIKQNIYAFYFSYDQDFSFMSGQYIQVTLPHDADERGTSRFFSIASSPQEKDIMITTKRPLTRSGENKESSFKKMLFGLEIGATVDAFGPMGTFTLDN